MAYYNQIDVPKINSSGLNLNTSTTNSYGGAVGTTTTKSYGTTTQQTSGTGTTASKDSGAKTYGAGVYGASAGKTDAKNAKTTSDVSSASLNTNKLLYETNTPQQPVADGPQLSPVAIFGIVMSVLMALVFMMSVFRMYGYFTSPTSKQKRN